MAMEIGLILPKTSRMVLGLPNERRARRYPSWCPRLGGLLVPLGLHGLDLALGNGARRSKVSSPCGGK